MEYLYRRSVGELNDGLNEWMADLEDIRDEAQECLDENTDESVREDIGRMDEILRLVSQAADLLGAIENNRR